MRTEHFQLPPQLQERIQVLTDAATRRDGHFVLYWAHHALRAHENPALATAAAIAQQLGLPLLIYQGLGGRHRYNSDRHHRFILEAARDFAAELQGHGQRLLFHLPHNPLAPGPLPNLLRQAALAVSELYPVPPFRQWYARHAAREPDLHFLLVDCSCNLPMTLSTGIENRAFRFRKAHMADLRSRIGGTWTELASWPPAFAENPGFVPFDLDRSLDDAIAACSIDHSVPPIAGTPGGSVAGYRRWQAFLEDGLGAYHHLRDDAALPAAVSRLSPYLHYGCVSPFRIAREADARGGEGAEKFLDELLTWRELSHHFCFHSPELESLDALPGWARASLEEHVIDPRALLLDWEKLARGRSGDPLWDLAQRSLLRRGELHNNVRMSWGKAFLPWASRPARALKLMIDLNHRYGLDGSDPNSYGGLLWCLGQFDRAFPPGPVFGKVRQRSLRRHAERLDLGRYAHLVSRPANGRRLRIAVVGAGLAGLNAARILEDQGHDVVVLDKSRGPGGRMSTRRQNEWQFDHGAQYFTARDPRFRRSVLAWLERGLVETWSARVAAVDENSVGPANADTERYVPIPSMSAVCREMASELADCRYLWQVAQAHCKPDGWRLVSKTGETLESDALLLALPPPQITPLLEDESLRERAERQLRDIDMAPCWAVLAVTDRPVLTDWDAGFVNRGPLSWICRQGAKPGRPSAETWVLHAGHEWSQAQIEAQPEAVCEQLLAAAAVLPGAAPFKVRFSVAHRWRYALASAPLQTGALWFADHRLALAGDWCHGSRVEGAFLSGAAAAGRILGSRWARRQRD